MDALNWIWVWLMLTMTPIPECDWTNTYITTIERNDQVNQFSHMDLPRCYYL
jgi:hypothetical protein